MKKISPSIKNLKRPVITVTVLFLLLLTLLALFLRDIPDSSGSSIIQFKSYDPAEELILGDNTGRLQLGKAIEYLPDAENSLSLNDILNEGYNRQFRSLWDENITEKYFPYYDEKGVDVESVWVRLTVEKIFSDKPILLTTPFNSTIISAYIPDKTGSYTTSYRRIENDSRLFANDPEIYILLPNTLLENSQIYIKMTARFKRRIKLDFSALKFESYTNEFSLRYHSKGIFTGFFAAILIFHIMVYLSSREERYYYYILFIFFLMLNRMITTQINLWKFWAGMFYLENFIYSFVLAGLQICGVHFIRKTLTNRYDTKKKNILDSVTNRLYVFYIVSAFLSGILYLPFQYRQIIVFTSISINTIIVYLYIFYGMSNSNKIANLYLLAFTPYFLVEAIFAIAPGIYSDMQSLMPYIEIRYLTDMIQSTLLAAAIGQDIVRYKKEKDISNEILRDRLQNENRYLEKEVEKRTTDLKEAMTIAEYANKAKSRFLANISHELRTPLGGIIGFAELIDRTEDREVQHQYNKKILAESEHLLSLISDVLNLSRIESGNYEIEPSSFVLKEKVHESLAGQIILIKEKGLWFELVLSENLPEVLIGDHHRLRQILLNLTNNAQKFTHKGQIRVVIEPELPAVGDLVLIRFEIQDTGMGISRQQADKIFQPFYQIDHSQSRNHDGTGLGTTISKKLVELMGGEIGYTPNTPTGSIFWFTLPFSIGSKDSLKKQEPEEPIKGSGKILIVDDYQTNREIASTYLQSLGYKPFIAEDGYKAISLCHQIQFDLILMDIQMPMLNGYDTVEKITGKCPINEKTPVLMLTAGGFYDESRDRICGVIKGIIYKPVQLNNISLSIAEILNPGALHKAADHQEDSGLSGLEAFLEQFEDREEGIEIIQEYLKNCRVDIAGMKEYIKNRDFKVLHRKAHSIKGGALNLGLTGFAESAGDLEIFIKENDFFPETPDDSQNEEILRRVSKLERSIPEITSLCLG